MSLPHAAGPQAGQVAHVSAFPQSSSWNFFDIAARTITTSVGALQRYSAGGINPYTVVVAQGFCRAFRLGDVGRANLNHALSSHSSISSLGQVLYFGFGVTDPVRTLAEIEEGAICLAICAALRECYHQDVAVEVLLEMARLTKVPPEYMPSSWRDVDTVNETRLFRALELFSGRETYNAVTETCAQSSNGICALLDALQKFEPHASAVNTITVIPGRIQFDTKAYTVLKDEASSLVDKTKNFQSLLDYKTMKPEDLALKLQVKEGPHALECMLAVKRPGIRLAPYLIGPARAAAMLADCRGFVSCKGIGKCKGAATDNYENMTTELQYQDIWLSSITISHHVEALTVLALASVLDHNCTLYILDNQCFSCATRAASAVERPERSHFCFARFLL